MSPEPGHPSTPTQAEERGAMLALLPVAATIDYYALPDRLQTNFLIQFAPQLIAYLAMTIWVAQNHQVLLRLGLSTAQFSSGVKLGLLTGLGLGTFNSLVILHLVPSLGYDITFLKRTPHAQLPILIMIPWFICIIALFVELNFRGFILGRLATLESSLWSSGRLRRFSPFALLASALVFTFDPFMATTFQHLHWIAIWDGLIWGWIWLHRRNLYATIIAHAVEVIVMYSAVRSALM